MSEILKKVGHRIRQIRKERGLSREELAYRASLHAGFIGYVERGEKSMTIESLEKLTDAFEITLEELFHGLQPSGKSIAETTLSKILDNLYTMNTEEQKLILEVTDFIIFRRSKLKE